MFFPCFPCHAYIRVWSWIHTLILFSVLTALEKVKAGSLCKQHLIPANLRVESESWDEWKGHPIIPRNCYVLESRGMAKTAGCVESWQEWRSEDSMGIHTPSLYSPAAAPSASSAHRPQSAWQNSSWQIQGQGFKPSVCTLKHENTAAGSNPSLSSPLPWLPSAPLISRKN